MQGKTVVVIGAAGGVGEGIVEELLASGASVIATARRQEKLESLARRLGSPGGLKSVVGALTSDQDALQLGREISEAAPSIDGAIASIGSWWQGARLIDTPLTEFNAVLAERLTSHFLAAKALIPLILRKPGGFYFLIGGASAEFPIEKSGPVSISGAAQVMFTKVLRAEARDLPIRIQELMVWTTIATRAHGDKADPQWVTPREVARHIAALVAAPDSAKDAVVHLKKRAGVGKVS
jgi:NAD(P)-dependent dehydrogenase (short-subunit alcohol dehydrogenase family)